MIASARNSRVELASRGENTVLTPNEQPTATTSRFQDIANDVYQQEITAAVERRIVAGFKDKTFRPQSFITREQLVSMVVEALSKLPYDDPIVTQPGLLVDIPSQVRTNPFPDVEAARWSSAKIQVARDLKLIEGYPDGRFRSIQPVTRAELITILQKAAEFALREPGGPQLPTEQRRIFPRDFSDISGHWASPQIRQLSTYCDTASPLNEAGDAFAPDRPAQRNYAAAATLRMLKCLL